MSKPLTIIWLPHFIEQMGWMEITDDTKFDILCYTPEAAKDAIEFFYTAPADGDPWRNIRVSTENARSKHLNSVTILAEGEHYLVRSFQDIKAVAEAIRIQKLIKGDPHAYCASLRSACPSRRYDL